MPSPFLHRMPAMRVRFGVGSLEQIGEEAAALGLGRALVVSTPAEAGLAGRVAEALGARALAVHAEAVMHVPVGVARSAADRAAEAGADALVAVGGGSAIGLAKAVALEHGLPILAVPTTYAGSEMTPIWGLTDGDVKRTGRDPRVLPRAVVYDPSLTCTLPAPVSAASAMNAIAHAVEALYAPDGSPLISLMAEEGVRALGAAIVEVVAAPEDLDARGEALCGAWLCGACLGAVTMSLHHKLCHVLGGAFDLPHAETHAVVLPYVVDHNAAAAPEAVGRLQRALGSPRPAAALQELGRAIGTPRSLAEIGLSETDLDRAVELATADPYANPAPVTADGIRSLLIAALHGEDL